MAGKTFYVPLYIKVRPNQIHYSVRILFSLMEKQRPASLEVHLWPFWKVNEYLCCSTASGSPARGNKRSVFLWGRVGR